jgi:hypothetical protein
LLKPSVSLKKNQELFFRETEGFSFTEKKERIAESKNNPINTSDAVQGCRSRTVFDFTCI